MALAAKQTAAAVKREIQALRDPVRASFLQKYFRTGVGEYGEGDRFLGLTVPQQRLIARAFRQLPLAEIEILLASPFHEHRSVALMVLAAQHDRADEKEKLTLHRFYLDHLAAVNNWDLVDGSTASLVGQHIAGNAALMRKLVKSENVWHRRIAIVSTFAEIRAGRTAATFAMAERLLSDKHDLIHKAVGWLLREAGKLSQDELLEFLRKNYGRLPRTTLRYAIERFDPIDRKSWLSGPK
jgi:3-methyladenine DNA glycosylase AlkD